MKINGEEQGIIKISDNKTPYLVGSECNNCNQLSFPKKEVCPICMTASDYEEVLFGNSGSIVNVTLCHTAPKGYSSPYALGVIKTSEGPKVVSQIEGEFNQLKRNNKVELIISPTSINEDGSELLGWKYKILD